jgi:hypothetical protein
MKTRSVLIHFPGYPLAMESLLPDQHLAAWAACLLDLGHRTRILDYGTLDWIDRQFPREGRELLKRLADLFTEDGPVPALGAVFTYWQLRHTDRAFRARQDECGREIARDVASRKNLDFALFKLDSVEDVEPASRMAARLREARPELRILAAGAVANAFAEPLLQHIPALDCVCVGDIERSLVRLAENLRNPSEWNDIPNLVFRDGTGVLRTERRVERDLALFPAPAYEPDVYPALAGSGKAMLFRVEDCRGRALSDPALPPEERELRLKDAPTVCKEVWRLHTLYGAEVFHFPNAGATAHHVIDVAREMQMRGLRVMYGRSLRPEAMDVAALPLLRASGCRAVDFRVDSGSQRLLDDYYRHEFCVSHAEQVLRSCRSYELFTSASFTYPSPADDYHTESETLRLIYRTSPDAVSVALANVLPGSDWYEDNAQYGFGMSKKTYWSDLLRCRTRFPLPPHRWPLSPYRVGHVPASEVIRQQERLLLALKDKTTVLFLSAELALWARLTGYAGREAEFQALNRRLLATEGVAGVATLVEAFNERACAPTKAVGFRPASSWRTAVGN